MWGVRWIGKFEFISQLGHEVKIKVHHMLAKVIKLRKGIELSL